MFCPLASRSIPRRPKPGGPPWRNLLKGYYVIPLLAVGNYELRVEQEGFSTLVPSNIPVKIGEAAVLNLALQIGMATEVVEAKEAAHKILPPTYYVLSHQVNYNELGDLYLDKLNQHHLKKNLVRRLERLGYKVTLEENAARDKTPSLPAEPYV